MSWREKGIKRIFSEVGPTYDLINRVLTFGLDVLWRKRAARLAARWGGRRWLDVCSGTGDMARALAHVAPSRVSITAVDFSLPMLKIAARKTSARPVSLVSAALPRLPFPDATFNLATMSFATRNINLDRAALRAAFAEIHRVLKPGGRFLNLETSQPPNRFLRALFHLYVRTAVKPLGRAISGSLSGYAYLSATIPRFYGAPLLTAVLADSGFGSVTHDSMFFGVAAVHAAVCRTIRPPHAARTRKRQARGFTSVPRGEG